MREPEAHDGIVNNFGDARVHGHVALQLMRRVCLPRRRETGVAGIVVAIWKVFLIGKQNVVSFFSSSRITKDDPHGYHDYQRVRDQQDRKVAMGELRIWTSFGPQTATFERLFMAT